MVLFTMFSVFITDPGHQQIDNLFLLLIRQFYTLRHFSPAFKTSPATAGTAMLSLEYRMASHRRLLTVIDGMSWSKFLTDKIFGMTADRLHALLINIGNVIAVKMKRGTEI